LNNQKILYIWDADYPWDVRVEKICNSLKNQGCEVHIAARNLKKLPDTEDIGGIYIHRLKALANDKLNYIRSFPLFFSPVWKKFLEGIIKTHNIGLIIVRDLPMAVAGIWAGRRHNIPVVFDMAEDYVAMIRDIWNVRKFQGLNLFLRNPYLAKCVERYTLANADHILVVVDEARDLVLARGGHPQRITIVGNTPHLESFNHNGIKMNGDLKQIADRFSAIYTGGIQMGRGIQTVIHAIPEIIKEIPNFLFVVVGDGYAVKQLKELAQQERVQDYILWTGWIDHEDLFAYIPACKIGIIPHLRTDHVDTTIPNKIFDYMACELPIIASDARPLKRILDEEQCGLSFSSGNYKSLVEAVIKVRKAKQDFGKNGKRAVECKYNWLEDEKRLVEVVRGFSRCQTIKEV